MKKVLLPVYTFTLLLYACSKTETPPQPTPGPETTDTIPVQPKPAAWYLVGRDEVYINDHDTTYNRYSYNEDSTISEIRTFTVNGRDTISSYTYNTYEQGKLVKVEVMDAGYNYKRMTRSLSYKDGRLLTVGKYGYSGGPNLESTDSMAYLPSGKLGAVYNRSRYYPNEGMVTRLTWTGDNITKTERYNIKGKDTTWHFTNDFTYNDSTNVYKKLFAYEYDFSTTDDAFDKYSANMKIRCERSFGGAATSIRFEYVYNDLSQVTKMNTTIDALFNGIVLRTEYHQTSFSYIKK